MAWLSSHCVLQKVSTQSKKRKVVELVSQTEAVTLQHVWQAKQRIQPLVMRTPLIFSEAFRKRFQANVYLKLENLHQTGAFKLRGAANKLLSLSDAEKERGVTTFSTGNHGLAVAYVAKQLGMRAVICVSNRVPQAKIARLNRLGAEVKIVGNSQDDAEEHSYALEAEAGLTVVKPFDDLHVIAGQGTIGLELLEDLPHLDMAIIPVSGGGLFSGIAFVLKENLPYIKLVAVSMERSPVMYESLRANRPVQLEEQETLADSLLGGIGFDNKYTFNIVKKYVDDFVLVSEEEIAAGMKFLAEEQRLIVEGAAATGVAAILSGKVDVAGKNVATIVTGNNVDIDVMKRIL